MSNKPPPETNPVNPELSLLLKSHMSDCVVNILANLGTLIMYFLYYLYLEFRGKKGKNEKERIKNV
jgi:hypothetical protein